MKRSKDKIVLHSTSAIREWKHLCLEWKHNLGYDFPCILKKEQLYKCKLLLLLLALAVQVWQQL